MNLDPAETTRWGAAIGAFGAIALGLRRAMKSWSSDGTQIAKSKVEADLYELLRQELKRVHESNEVLQQEVHKLRDQVAQLTAELAVYRPSMFGIEDNTGASPQ